MNVTPMVDMNNVRASWLTSGPITNRSISQAVIAMITAAKPMPRMIAAQSEKPQTTRRSSEQHHCALRKIKDTGCLEDQHEAERDQRVQHAGHQSADQHFEKLTQR